MAKVTIVAEISGNHGGELKRAQKLIQEAAFAGCQYAKFQYYRPEDMPDRGDNDAMYRKLAVPDDWLPHLFGLAKECGIGLFASVFSARAVHELLKYDVPFIKIASTQSTPLAHETYRSILAAVPADVGLIVSEPGLGYLTSRFMLFCPVGHPPVITEEDLRLFCHRNYYGFSDHTPGIRAPLAFIRAGAKMIEKHLKLKLDDDCVDAAFSADPHTMRQLCTIANE